MRNMWAEGMFITSCLSFESQNMACYALPPTPPPTPTEAMRLVMFPGRGCFTNLGPKMRTVDSLQWLWMRSKTLLLWTTETELSFTAAWRIISCLIHWPSPAQSSHWGLPPLRFCSRCDCPILNTNELPVWRSCQCMHLGRKLLLPSWES